MRQIIVSEMSQRWRALAHLYADVGTRSPQQAG